MRNCDIRSKYISQKHSAEKRGIQWQLTFDEWYNWWQSTGHWHQRGRRRDEYCMCRHGDVGPYSLTNIYCDTNENNCRQNGSKTFLGRQHSLATKQKLLGRVNNNLRTKRVSVNGHEYNSLKDAERATGIRWVTISRRIKRNEPGYKYLGVGHTT